MLLVLVFLMCIGVCFLVIGVVVVWIVLVVLVVLVVGVGEVVRFFFLMMWV